MQIARRVVTFSSKNSATRLTLSETTQVMEKAEEMQTILFVFKEMTKVARGSNIQWRGRSYAASVPSDTPKPHKGRKRVSKDERKAMVESFVSKYRAMNAGKFPSASDARKEVGGCYYVIRKFVQELEYSYKISPLNKMNEKFLVKELTKENGSLIEVEVVSSSQMTVDTEIQNGSQSVEAKGGLQTHTWVEKTSFEGVGKSQTLGDQTHMQEKGTKDVSQRSFLKPEDDKKKDAAAVDLLDFDGPKHRTKQDQGSLKLDNFERTISGKQASDEEHSKSSTMWGNLKSLADSIINIWRKL